VWVAVRTRLKVTVTLEPSTFYVPQATEQIPLAKVLVNAQGKALTVEDIAFEWVSPMPRPESWGWGPPSALELGLPPDAAAIPAVAEITSPIPPHQAYFLRDGETKSFTACIRLHTDWGDGTEWSGHIRAHVRMSNRTKSYVSNTGILVFRPELLKAQIAARRDPP
jgi:hypothetical protein